MTRRVVITGLGPVASIGVGVEEFRSAVRNGTSGIGPDTRLRDQGFPTYHTGALRFDPSCLLRRLSASGTEWSDNDLLAAAAARLAVMDAGLDEETLRCGRTAAIVGTTHAETETLEAWVLQATLRGGPEHVSPALLDRMLSGNLAVAASRELGLTGEAVVIPTVCAAASYAVGYGYDRIRHGEVDIVVAGGADLAVRMGHAGFTRLGALAKTTCAPFDQSRSGTLIGEGGAVVVLEELTAATARGAHVYAEVLGYGVNCDARSMVSPTADRIAACIRKAHRQAGIEPADVGYISAHGTGTRANDAAEANAIMQVFGVSPPPTSSTKSVLGHTMGAAAGFNVIAAALALDEGYVPPTVHFTAPDAETRWLDVVANKAREVQPGIAEIHGFGFGGLNAVLMLGRMR